MSYMKRNCPNIKAEGQDDGKLCWAACIAWWTRATDRINREQNWVQTEFSQLWEPPRDGTIDDFGMQAIVSDSRFRMYAERIDTPSGLTREVMERYLNYGPVYIGFYDSGISSAHVNVIYDMGAHGANPSVKVMEPRFKETALGKFEGKHLTRTLSYYKSPGCKIWVASPRPY